MKRSLLILAGLILAVASCRSQRQTQAEPAPKPQADSAVHAIELPRYQPNLPAAPERDVFAVACLSCHSARYVTMQPPMTAAKWEESVRKMIKTFGAPITEQQVPQIVQYIMTKGG